MIARRELLVVVSLALTGLAGCYYLKYPRLVRAHVEILTAMATKMADVAREGSESRPEHLAEFRYPYDRARDFVRIVRGRFGERASFRGLETLLDHYVDLLAAADRLHVGTGDASELARLAGGVHEQAGRVLDALENEA